MKKLQNLTPDDVMSVYSGKAHKCCCGCAGKHYYNSRYIAEATKDRGYEISADEISDKMVTKVLRIIQSEDGEVEDTGEPGPFVRNVSVEVGPRLYIAYLRR